MENPGSYLSMHKVRDLRLPVAFGGSGQSWMSGGPYFTVSIKNWWRPTFFSYSSMVRYSTLLISDLHCFL